MRWWNLAYRKISDAESLVASDGTNSWKNSCRGNKEAQT